MIMEDINNKILLIQQLCNEWRYTEAKWLISWLKDDLVEVSWEREDFIVDTPEYFSNLKDRMVWKWVNKFIPTWFKSIDDRVYGAFVWEIMTICARSGWGKTTLGINIATNMCKNNKVWFISLEMTEEDLFDKIVSRVCRIPHTVFQNNEMAWSNQDIQKLREHKDDILKIRENLLFAYKCFNIDEIERTVCWFVKRWCKVVFVDWIGMVEWVWKEQKDKIHNAIHTLKELAQAHNIAIVIMQQLNRQIDNTNRPPYMYDIADSSSIEKISSPVIILWRWNWDNEETNVSLYKTRRVNVNNFMNENWYYDWDEITQFSIWNDLAYCWYKDIDIKEKENKDNKEVKPF